MRHSAPRSRIGRATVFATGLVLVLAAAGSLVPQVTAAAGHTVTFALPPNTEPTYVFPMVSGPQSDPADLYDLEPLLYRPLYWFGLSHSLYTNTAISIAHPPIFSNGGKTVTINLKHWLWSDGTAVTNRDVEFWMNLLMANKTQGWYDYNPPDFPDNIVSMSFPPSNPRQFSLTFNQAYNHAWLIYNELSQIFPIPQQTWDKTSESTPVGNYDLTPSGARQVWTFLNGESTDLTTYATNPLWKVVDGPWLISDYSPPTGEVIYAPNSRYSGSRKGNVTRLVMEPFTSTAAEYDSLRSGALDYGYLPAEDYSQAAYFRSHGYVVSNWNAFGMNFISLNFSNPKVGPMLSQLYVRQAMESLMNQPAVISAIFHGTAVSTYGPIPTVPRTNLIGGALKRAPYPYDPAKARTLLKSHGWLVQSGGTDRCEHPGTGTHDCGAGISKGERLSFTLEYATGDVPFASMVETFKSGWSLAGINVILNAAPDGIIFAAARPCVPTTGTGCTWDMLDWGSAGDTPQYSPTTNFPSGEFFLAPNATGNNGHYLNNKLDALIAATPTSSGLTTLRAYGVAAAQQLPVLWQPEFDEQTSVISKHLHGVFPQSPLLSITPMNWVMTG